MRSESVPKASATRPFVVARVEPENTGAPGAGVPTVGPLKTAASLTVTIRATGTTDDVLEYQAPPTASARSPAATAHAVDSRNRAVTRAGSLSRPARHAASAAARAR